MKNSIFLVLIILSGMIILESFESMGLGKKDGTDPGYTGSPGDSLKNCTVCHGGTAHNVSGWITSNIPGGYYIPGETYTVTATNSEMGATRFGFEVSPQAIDGSLLGTMVITDTATTKLVGNDKYITYKAAGVSGVNSRSWSFNWIAPPAGTGEVVFYGAFNSNFNGNKDGDHTYLTTLKVRESGTTGISTISEKISNLRVYPNPATDLINLSFEAKTQKGLTIDIADLAGRCVALIFDGRQGGTIVKSISTTELPNGIYVLRVQTDGTSTTQKIVIAH